MNPFLLGPTTGLFYAFILNFNTPQVRHYLQSLSLEIKSQRDGTNYARLFRRCQAILLSSKGHRTSRTGEVLDVSTRTVRNWIHRYGENGVEGLRDKPRSGRPPKVTEEYERILLETIRKNPRLYGYPFSNWTTRKLSIRMERETGISLSQETVRRILHRNRMAVRRPKLRVTSNDLDYDIKKEESSS